MQPRTELILGATDIACREMTSLAIIAGSMELLFGIRIFGRRSLPPSVESLVPEWWSHVHTTFIESWSSERPTSLVLPLVAVVAVPTLKLPAALPWPLQLLLQLVQSDWLLQNMQEKKST